MLEEVSVTHYQSLHDVSVKLGRFTVIVGPSSSGKSAFTRALRCLTSNQRGDSFISHGETQAVIQARTEHGTVALMRGKKNEYVIIPEAGEQQVFTKLAGTTPEEVSQFIGIASKDPLNYSNQFDMPYLLTASAAEVARTLGDLTNVSVIFEASREANRKRLAAGATLKARSSDYQSLTSAAEAYKNLPARVKKLAALEAAVQQSSETSNKILRLRSLINAAAVQVSAINEVEPPTVTHLEGLTSRAAGLKKILDKLEAAGLKLKAAAEVLPTIEAALQQAAEDYGQTLKDAGTCPTCGQSTEHAAH